MASGTSSSDFISEFFFYLHKVTGYRKEAFSTKGLKLFLKDSAVKFYQLNLTGKALELIFQIVNFFTDRLCVTKENVEKVIVTFVSILQKFASFLVQNWAGKALLCVLVNASAGMTVFLTTLFHTVMFIYNILADQCFLKLKEWLIWLLDTETMRNFFDKVFPNYGKTIANGNSGVTIVELN